MTIAETYIREKKKKERFEWSPSGKLCLELILAEVNKNGKFVYARENLSTIEFENFTREVYHKIY